MTADLDVRNVAASDDASFGQANAIEVDHIVKKYGDFTAVDDVSFTVKEGEIFGLLGPNGAGKSTLIRMMTTLIPITGGAARILGHDVSKDPDAARRAIGVIPQALTSDIDLTVEENLNIYAKLYEVPAKETQRSDRRIAGTRRPDQVAWGTNENSFGRYAETAGNRAGIGP